MSQTFPLVDKVGGSIRANEIIARATGRSPTMGAVAKWREAGVMPAMIALPLIWDCLARGVEVGPNDILCDPMKPKITAKRRKSLDEEARA